MKSPNLTIIFVAVVVVVLAGLGGGVTLTILRFDASVFYGFFTATLATVIAFGGVLRGQAKIDQRVTEVKANVNGRMTQLIDLAMRNAQTRDEAGKILEIAEAAGLAPDEEGGGNG